MKTAVLIGEKEHKALYPKRLVLLADAIGMSVTKALTKWILVNMI
jgi:hypothetical protein